MKRILKAVALSGLLTLSNNAFTADWFKVEVVVFANNASEPLSAEYWPTITEIPEKSRATYLGGEGNGAYQRLSSSALSLKQAKNSLRAKGDYKVLFHSAWMQPVVETQNPRPIKIRGGDILDNGMHELEGYIAVGRGRYLHFRPDLYLNRPLSTEESALLKNPISSQAKDSISDTQLTMQSASGAAPSNNLIQLPDILTVNLNQARRMRSKELHYIDHPLMGILVEIKPAQ
ncbi:CsiV family protein [Neptuniibacter caesariensis]|uniref:Peptidoglycan-binding protein CsiV n=1 Tax=Neptuniibacter caesariensis TaxID=207954 RepID=A0A7U8C643_NEPCE|nr:CsiV family protein [Neptuniibacter caesariensis]EAR60589.1 hypothetical protein MED92_09301 [Oceanospirillum sp. MED92] [Neptuniibacter caesariensis]